ncbi:hypothetical protein L1S32_03995 [Methanogenium sp. S4BF]|uniref:hypothetical protein n=1 Tax=Methanogenium sp. S4BF TaxID=1789226 RepID=UPI002416C2D3|nr:hypothetical protein [Methanogenium sp. S4BF]WFN35290.1 hypothetical protein L1S32_03995 [Methanogenium sp. S4BF]
MEPYQKLFAGDLNSGRATIKNNGIRALSGRTITKCLFCGALTEVPDTNKPVVHLTLYDPTGMLVVGYHTANKDISAVLKETALPAFVLCAAGIRCTAGECMPMLETLVPVSRSVRDTFVLAAADDLITLLEQPDMEPDRKKQLCKMTETALSTVLTGTPAPAAPEPVVDDAVLIAVVQEIRNGSDEKNTVRLDALMAALETRGITRETTRAALKTMIEDGDCYQPKPDLIRLL